MSHTEFRLLRRAFRQMLRQGVHPDVAAVIAATDTVEAGVRAGFVLRHALALPSTEARGPDPVPLCHMRRTDRHRLTHNGERRGCYLRMTHVRDTHVGEQRFAMRVWLEDVPLLPEVAAE